jgi:hypothetical protein
MLVVQAVPWCYSQIGRSCGVRAAFAVLSQQRERREPRAGEHFTGVVAPTCESRFKAPMHTACAGEAITPAPAARAIATSGDTIT